ncbi:hypothetical protein APHWI1_0360 [Anaplasma phagocytophilum str. ApWI1]|uniref:Uncharacterized protein n=1 Tax=Anaplasma phagocytophilum str. ApWI1 TaxID=1359155 RepID=A0A0F3PY49_ANAPH|nr:hypothetical protein APHWEB_1156 [Anaplasma phagocytophilum str. Webster]KJV83284.1 hypothetical protein APHHGE2_1157 [Anaplasma phagocytophilum str. HGE2]KJV84114.1 hypothetical protein APHWI1_0360 [Anaplasma phagocytophilum str. ApWI1]KJV97774.1 hypothetical protein OTSANNIE_1633 [Anaplasma phagocytophilum str. Annie]KJZ99628.1 hypothetical protein APHDU1_0157 [Anaplasma phagocytophilum]
MASKLVISKVSMGSDNENLNSKVIRHAEAEQYIKSVQSQ